MTLYLDEPDHTGHSHGPYDKTGELDKALKRVDTIIGMTPFFSMVGSSACFSGCGLQIIIQYIWFIFQADRFIFCSNKRPNKRPEAQ